MKKLTPKYKAYLLRRAAKKKRKKKFSDRLVMEIRELFQKLDYPFLINGRKLVFNAPVEMDLSKNYEETIKFLKALRAVSPIKLRRITAQFSTIKKISPLAALLLTSEVHRWQLTSGALRLWQQKKWDPIVKRLLYEMGFFDLVETVNRVTVDIDSPGPLQFAKFRSGQLTVGEEADDLRLDLEGMAGPINSSSLMYGGLTEAMKNVLHWAYPGETIEPLKRWWMSGSYHHEQKRMTVMIYDHGVGIPATLPRSSLWEKMQGFLASNDDPDMIEAAMSVGRSATGHSYRGKGLADIQKFVLSAQRGVLRIISGKGSYTVNHNGVSSTSALNTKLDGTLIAWEIYGPGENIIE